MLGNWDLLQSDSYQNHFFFLQLAGIVENTYLLISNLKINWLLGLNEF